MAIKVIKISLSTHKNIILCVAENKAEEILQYLLDDSVISEFRKIKSSLFENLHIKTLYQKVKSLKSVYEMRFTNNGRNDRIYCKEISQSKKRYIILVKLFNKKSQNIPKQISSQLKEIDKYEFNI